MKITTKQIKQIINEELDQVLNEESKIDKQRNLLLRFVKVDDYYSKIKQFIKANYQKIQDPEMLQGFNQKLIPRLNTSNKEEIASAFELLRSLVYFDGELEETAEEFEEFLVAEDKKIFLVDKKLETAYPLRGINFSFYDLTGYDLSDLDLENARFQNTTLSRANLSGCNLRGANFFRSGLRNANLEGADLTGAVLEYTYLRGANLINADLTNAIIKGAEMTELESAKGIKLEGAKRDHNTKITFKEFALRAVEKNKFYQYYKKVTIYVGA